MTLDNKRKDMHAMVVSSLLLCPLLLLLLLLQEQALASPLSKPYIAYRTSPFDQNVHHNLDWDSVNNKRQLSRAYRYDEVPSEQCPLQFSMGIAKRMHRESSSSITQAPVLATVFPARGPGKQVIYTTHYEHVDLLSPAVLESSGTAAAASSSSQDAAIIQEALVQPPDFPLLFESSAFLTSPIVHDVNGDGIMDVIVADYDGGISITGLAGSAASRRYFHHTQVPRLYVRREWVQSRVNETLRATAATGDEPATNDINKIGPDEPYHSYFEYYYAASSDKKEELIRGETANVLGQKSADAAALKERRSRKMQDRRGVTVTGSGDNNINEGGESMDAEEQGNENQQRRRLQEVTAAEEPQAQNAQDHPDANQQPGNVKDVSQRLEADQNNEQEAGYGRARLQEEQDEQQPPRQDLPNNNMGDNNDLGIPELDEMDRGHDDMIIGADDMAPPPTDEMMFGDDLEYARHGEDGEELEDDYARYKDYYGDDMYMNDEHSEYYDSKHYIRIPPHILTQPVLAEVPKMYGNTNEMDDILLVAVSYFLDEDEYEGFFTYNRFEATDQGDENEVRRGAFVASGIMGYILGESGGRWTGQTHLELSTDFSAPENATVVGDLEERQDLSKMSAFALSSPTVADVDGDGNPEVIVGTNMGIVYSFDARQMFKRENWPVQMKRPVEQRILVEDVVGNCNLEVFVADIGGNVVCLTHEAQLVWHRDLLASLNMPEGTEISASSPMTLGDVNGDGRLDVVQVIRVNKRSFVFAMDAATGDDLPRFPIELDGAPKVHDGMEDLHEKLPQPLLVDLHTDQSFLNDYLRRNGTQWQQRKPSTGRSPHGGSGPGMHIVQPHGEDIFIIEAYSGCTQKMSIGEEVSAMVQVDDVHGTNKLDLVVATESGNIVTLESMASYHPLNTWTHGEVRGRSNLHAHGYSASQGIFVHEVSRQFRDVFGVYVPVTFEIFDNRPNIQNEPNRRKYVVEIRDGSSWKRLLWRQEYTEPGVYTDRVYVRYGPGYYTLFVTMRTSHGLIYEDTFSIGYNVKFLDGFGTLLWLPLLVASAAILLCGAKKTNWDDEEFDGGRDGHSMGILGRALPT